MDNARLIEMNSKFDRECSISIYTNIFMWSRPEKKNSVAKIHSRIQEFSENGNQWFNFKA